MRLEFFSDVSVWFCVHVNIPICESRIYAVAKVSLFQLTTTASNHVHSAASSAHIRPLKYILFNPVAHIPVREPQTLWSTCQNFSKTRHNVIGSLLRSLLQFLENSNAQLLVVPGCQSFLRLMNLLYLWTITWEQVFLWVATPLDTVVEENWSEKSRICCRIIGSDVMHVSSWVYRTTIPNFIAIGWELSEMEAM